MNSSLKKLILFTFLSATIIGCKKDEDPIVSNTENLKPTVKLITNPDGQSFEYEINEGAKIVISKDEITISHKKYENFKIALWGVEIINNVKIPYYNHENLNGKHIKDRLDSVRTVTFQDGTKITLNTEGAYGKLKSVSFYYNSNSHVVVLNNNLLSFTSNVGTIANQLDVTEPDGETSIVEITNTGLIWDNIYTENIAGEKIMKRIKLGVLIRSNPNMVNDYFDDPRLAAT